MPRVPPLPALTLALALLAGCGGTDDPARAVEDAVLGDWEGAEIAAPAVEWPAGLKMLAGSHATGIACRERTAALVTCEVQVEGGRDGFAGRVTVEARLDDRGTLRGWEVTDVRREGA